MPKLRRRPGHPVLRDVATLCLDPFPVPGGPLVCELDKGHLEQGVRHKSGCTRWGRPMGATDEPA